jgi:hypothetical protein
LGSAVADDFANAAVTGYSEIVVADGNFKFSQNVIVRFMGFHLIIGYKLADRL